MKPMLNALALAVLTLTSWSCGTTSPEMDAGAPAPTCASYCTSVMASCIGANAQYPSQAACLGSCSAFAQGVTGATSGNTLSCRAYHAAAAAADPTVHCAHAGPAGDGSCGGNCDGFCAIAVAKCGSEFPDATSCMCSCNGFALSTAHYTDATTTGDSFSCRLYHLSVAASDATSAATHCPHTTTASAPGTCQ